MVELTAIDGRRPTRKGRRRRVLDLLLHQLAAHDAVRPRVGREVQGTGAGRDRCALAGVRVREEHRQRPPGSQGDGCRLSDCGRQRSRGLACLRQRILAGPLLHRRQGTDSPSSFRRRRVRPVGAGHSRAAVGIRRQRRWTRLGRRRRQGCRGGRRLGQPRVGRELCGLCADAELRVSGRKRTGQAARLRYSFAAATQ